MPVSQCFSLLAVLLALAAPGRAADFAVDTLADAVDAAPGDGVCATAAGACTLRAAVQEANALAGADAIFLAGGVHRLSLAGDFEDAGASGDLDVTGALAIHGAGATETFVDAAGLDRALQVGVGADVALFDLTLENGWRPEDEQGGALYNDGDLTLVRVRVRGSEAWLSGGIANFGMLWLRHAEVRGNRSTTLANVLGGGGIGNAGTLLVDDSTIADNQTLGTGGGIGTVGDVEILRSTLSGNHAARNGGGIVSGGGALSIVNSTLSGNSSNESGGGVSTAGSPLTLSNVTLAKNVADADGDGAGDGGGLRSSGPTLVRNTLVVDNRDAGGEAPDCAGGLVSEGHNLIGDPTGCSIGGSGAAAVSVAAARLAPLGAYGGPTATHALLPHSVAIDAGSPAGALAACEAEDQRAAARPEDGDADDVARCDVGAFELPEPSATATQWLGACLVAALSARRRGARR